MTGPEDSPSNTRPISVAELLAKNGTVGAPPIGGRRRRRRGDTDRITVAELTGEIPVVRDHDADEPATGDSSTAVVDEPVVAEEPAPSNGAVDHVDDTETVDESEPAAPTVEQDHQTEHADATDEAETAETADMAVDTVVDEDDDAAADYAAHIEARDVDEDLDFFSPPRRSSYAPRRFGTDAGVGAEQMSPDPLDWAQSRDDEDEAADAAVDLAEPDDDGKDARPSYLRSSGGTLFGGQTVADDLARRGASPGPEDIDFEDDIEPAPAGAMSAFVRGAWVVGQCIIAVAFGAGLFVAFDQLWKWNSIVALVLGVLVILGLVVGVRVVRKTEDIGSTLIAVAVGALVTFGPLALLKA